MGLKGKKFIVQGFGNVGYWASKFFVQDGAILVGVCEADGSLFCDEGIDPDKLLSYKMEKRGVTGFFKAEGMKGSSFVDDAAMY